MDISKLSIPIHFKPLPMVYWQCLVIRNGLEAERSPVENEYKHMRRWYFKIKFQHYIIGMDLAVKAFSQACVFSHAEAKAFGRACARLSQASKKIHFPSTASPPLIPKKQRQGRARKIETWHNQRRGEGRR